MDMYRFFKPLGLFRFMHRTSITPKRRNAMKTESMKKHLDELKKRNRIKIKRKIRKPIY